MKTTNDEPGRFTAPGEIRFQRLLPGPIERVWEYLTDSDKRGRWLARGPMELRPGGAVLLEFRHAELTPHPEVCPARHPEVASGDGCAGRFTGRVLRCDPPRLLSHTWGEADGTESVVTYELTPQEDGVLLVLVHARLGDNRAQLTSVAAGWHTHLAILAARLENAPIPPFWSTHDRLETDYESRLPAPAPMPAQSDRV